MAPNYTQSTINYLLTEAGSLGKEKYHFEENDQSCMQTEEHHSLIINKQNSSRKRPRTLFMLFDSKGCNDNKDEFSLFFFPANHK